MLPISTVEGRWFRELQYSIKYTIRCRKQSRSMSERHTAENLPEGLRKAVEESGLEGKFIACVHDNASNILLANTQLLEWDLSLCFAHTLQLAINYGFKVNAVSHQSRIPLPPQHCGKSGPENQARTAESASASSDTTAPGGIHSVTCSTDSMNRGGPLRQCYQTEG